MQPYGPPHSLNEIFTGRKPHGFQLGNGPYKAVGNWRDLYLQICRFLVDYDFDRLMQLMQDHVDDKEHSNPRGHKEFKSNPEELREPILVSHGIYAEGNHSANTLRDLLGQLLIWFRIDPSSLIIFWQEDVPRQTRTRHTQPTASAVMSPNRDLSARIEHKLRSEKVLAGGQFSVDQNFEAFRGAWLEEVRAGNPSNVELGHRFSRKMLRDWLDINDASDDLIFCDGAGDGGIDIAYLQRGEDRETELGSPAEGDRWYLVQSKYGSAFQGTNTLLEEAQKVVETLDGQRPRLSSIAADLLERLKNFRQQASDLDRVILVFATEEPLTDAQRRTLDDIRAMGRNRLGSIFDVEAVSLENIYVRTIEELTAATLSRTTVPIRAQLTQSGDDLLVGSVTLLNLYDFLKAYRNQTGDLDQLYEMNVRRFLGGRGRVNKAIQNTLNQEPERFGLYNNGITIVVEAFDQKGDGTMRLVEPYIVNGCQTTKTIWEVCRQKLDAGGTGSNPVLDGWRTKAGQGVVVTKIVRVGAAGLELLQNITRYTNSQNAIREKDFLALTNDFRGWARQMADQYNIYLEIQRGGWDSRRALQAQNPELSPQFKEAANAFDLLKVYGAGWLGEAGVAYSRNAAFLPAGSVFNQIMSTGSEGDAFGIEDLYAAYTLQKAAEAYNFGRGAEQLSRRQTRFLFYTIVLDLLKDVMIRAGRTASPKNLTRALIRIFASGNEAAAQSLLEAAIEVIDQYLTVGTDYSMIDEPAYTERFNRDLNAMLKWEQLGKSRDATPHLQDLLAVTKQTLKMRVGGQASARDLVTSAISS